MSDANIESSSRFGRFPKAIARSGLSRGTIYGLAKKHEGLIRKAGKCSIIDLLLLDEIVAGLPAAELGDPQKV